MNAPSHLPSTGWRFWRNRTFLRVALGLALLVTGGSALYFLSDGLPPDDADLNLPEWAPAPEGHSLALIQHIPNQSPHVGASLGMRVSQPLPDIARLDEVRQVLADSHDTLQAFDRLMKTDHRSWRWPAPSNRSFPELETLILPVRIRNHLHAAEGRPMDAIQGSLALLRFIRGIESAQGPHHHQYRASSYVSPILGDLNKALVQHPLSSSELADVQNALSTLEPSRPALQRLARFDYTESKELYYHPEKLMETPHKTWTGPFSIIRLKRNLTLQFAAEYHRHFIASLDAGWKEAREQIKVPPARWLRYNPTGQPLVEDITHWLEYAFTGQLSAVVRQRQLVIALALRRHELDHGSLPPFLDVLVPKYLEAVPVDPFANQPMQWSLKRRIVYSVGSNGIDDDGIPNPPTSRRTGDWVWNYWQIPAY